MWDGCFGIACTPPPPQALPPGPLQITTSSKAELGVPASPVSDIKDADPERLKITIGFVVLKWIQCSAGKS